MSAQTSEVNFADLFADLLRKEFRPPIRIIYSYFVLQNISILGYGVTAVYSD